MTTKNDQEHCQEKPRISETNSIHINQTLDIKSKPKTTNMELESPEVLAFFYFFLVTRMKIYAGLLLTTLPPLLLKNLTR